MNEVKVRQQKRFWPVRLLGLLLATVGAVWVMQGRPPADLGVQDGKLAPCPESPNCVSTQAEGEQHAIAPLEFSVDLAAIRTAVRSAILQLPRTKIVEETDNYFHADCRSLVIRFIDDLEVWIDSEQGLVHARSASRVGYSDMGVNRGRVESLFTEIKKQLDTSTQNQEAVSTAN